MMRARTILIASLLVMLPRGARADSSTNALREELAALCTDESEVVGYRRCTPYGTWSLTTDQRYAFIDYGVAWRHVRRDGSRTRLARATSTPQEDDRSTSSLVFVERIGIGLSPGVHVALEFEIGNFELGDSNRDIIFGGIGAFGFLGNIAGPLSLGCELGAGYRGYTDADNREVQGEAVLEARGRGVVWATPWFTIGGVAGASLLRRGDWMVGLNLGFHSRAFGDTRR